MNDFLKITNHNFIALIIFLSLYIEINNSSCTNGGQITDTNCFNNLIILQNYYRAGQFATDKEGNMIIEYSNDHSGVKQYRLLYGLKKNGRNYFENDNAHKIIKIETSENVTGRYEARNIFVSLENDANKEKQYLFSTSAYITLTELYDIEGDSYVVKNTLDFWNIIDIFSYQYSLIEWRKNNKNIYFCVFTQHEADKMTVKEMVDGVEKDVEKDYSKTFTIKKFKFTSFNLENGVEIEGLNNTNNYNNRIISSFVMEQDQILVVLYMKRLDADFKFTKFTIIFYDFDLTEKNEITMIDNNIDDPRSGTGLFFKGLYLKESYAAFMYFLKGYDQTKIQVDISSLSQNSVSGEYSFTNIISKQDDTYYFISDVELNEFIKINDERLVFISSKKISDEPLKFQLHILLYDLYNTYTQMKIRHFYYDLNNYQLRKELTAYVFNGFLIFSSTAVTPPSYTSDNYTSLLVFFGYPNGTDHEVDISPYLMDVDSYDSNYNIYNYLKSKKIIENNIFGYEEVDKINLVSIPDELLFYNVTGGVQDTNPLPNNTFFDANHKLYQNFHLNKTFKYYYLDYQYIVKEPQYSEFYPSDTVDYPSTFDASTDYEASRKTFYGRTNRIKFKLCYEYCNHCLEFGKTIVDQKCLSCLEDYSYDYWTYLGKYYGNCVAENQYYDKPNNQIINCDSTFKYLIDHETNKKICFKEEDVCPNEYSKYDSLTNQCEYTPIIITTPIFETTAMPIITTENIPICNFDSYYNNECKFLNYSESQVLDKVRELITSYPNNNKSLSVSMPTEDALEITNDKKELLFLNDTQLPWLDLGECGEKIRALYRNNSNEPLIIIKYGIISDLTYEKELQYEVYDPDNFTKIDLSICNDSNVNLYIEMPISDELAKILKNIIDQGYNPFDINDKFYREICTPYDSENGTDVLLDAREEYYYSSLNEIVCPDNCHAANYDLDSKYLKCECEVNDTDITLNLKHITGENIGNSFYSTLKNSNWKVMICYNLVFNLKIFAHNYGSIISLIFFLVYVGFIVYYILRGIEPLQLEVSKIMFKDMQDEEDKKEENANTAKTNKIKNKKKGKGKKVKIKEPPKKGKSRKENADNTGITIAKDSDNTKTVSFNEAKKLKNEKLMTNPGKTKSKNNPFKDKFKKELIYTEGANLKNKKEKKENEIVDEEIILNLSNFQLNKLEYLDACKYDKRPFLKIYWSVLMREHILLFTFFSWNDYNLFYIKIERFLVLICTQMAMNGLFFSDESMHKANKTDDYNFVQQLPKIIFSLIATHIIEVLLCYLSMTDTTIYRIKELSRSKQNEEKILDEIKCMKRKLIGFFISTCLLFLFYWYFISAFCAVYQNTQKTFLLDSLISIIVQFIDPFFIYGLKILLRHLSMLKCANKKLGCVYKTSDLIPIF